MARKARLYFPDNSDGHIRTLVFFSPEDIPVLATSVQDIFFASSFHLHSLCQVSNKLQNLNQGTDIRNHMLKELSDGHRQQPWGKGHICPSGHI